MLQRGVTAYLALGANLGDRRDNILSAVSMLDETPGIRVLAVSTLIETQSEGGPVDAPAYLNGAARLQTTLGSHALLQQCLEVEKRLGRVRNQKNDPRTIDLDILFFGDAIISSQELVIPHPLMHERLFVLRPLSEIAADVVHPVLLMTVRGLLESAETVQRRSRATLPLS